MAYETDDVDEAVITDYLQGEGLNADCVVCDKARAIAAVVIAARGVTRDSDLQDFAAGADDEEGSDAQSDTYDAAMTQAARQEVGALAELVRRALPMALQQVYRIRTGCAGEVVDPIDGQPRCGVFPSRA